MLNPLKSHIWTQMNLQETPSSFINQIKITVNLIKIMEVKIRS